MSHFVEKRYLEAEVMDLQDVARSTPVVDALKGGAFDCAEAPAGAGRVVAREEGCACIDVGEPTG
jgi:hypothetical protein